MSKFKVGDRVAVYNFRGRHIVVVKQIDENGYLKFDSQWRYHPKQCRRLVPKSKNKKIVSTSKGFLFKDVENGSWTDLTSGLTWHDTEKEKYTHHQAIVKFGNKLPTIEEFEEAEKHGFREVIPNVEGRWFWSASLTPYNTYFARLFYGYNGYSYYYFRNNNDSVRCVGR